MKAVLVSIMPVAQNIKTFTFRPSEPLPHEAGQFTTIILEHPGADDRGVKRWFTISSSPTEPDISITTKFSPERSSSFKKALFGLAVGASVEMLPAEGDFVLPPDAGLELIFIAGGMGITPFRSMIKYLADSAQKRSIKLLYGLQSSGEMAFGDLFKSYKGLQFVPSVGERFTTAGLMKTIGSPVGKLVYLSGPEPMVEALTDSLVAAGLPADQLKSDYFPGYENNYSN